MNDTRQINKIKGFLLVAEKNGPVKIALNFFLKVMPVMYSIGCRRAGNFEIRFFCFM